MEDRLIGPKEAAKVTSLSRTSIWRLERENKFPKRYRLGNGKTGRVAYKLSEVMQWIEKQERAV